MSSNTKTDKIPKPAKVYNNQEWTVRKTICGKIRINIKSCPTRTFDLYELDGKLIIDYQSHKMPWAFVWGSPQDLNLVSYLWCHLNMNRPWKADVTMMYQRLLEDESYDPDNIRSITFWLEDAYVNGRSLVG